jgi:hypothetical protein
MKDVGLEHSLLLSPMLGRKWSFVVSNLLTPLKTLFRCSVHRRDGNGQAMKRHHDRVRASINFLMRDVIHVTAQIDFDKFTSIADCRA